MLIIAGMSLAGFLGVVIAIVLVVVAAIGHAYAPPQPQKIRSTHHGR